MRKRADEEHEEHERMAASVLRMNRRGECEASGDSGSFAEIIRNIFCHAKKKAIILHKN